MARPSGTSRWNLQMGVRELLAKSGKLKLANFSEERVPTACTARPLCVRRW